MQFTKSQVDTCGFRKYYAGLVASMMQVASRRNRGTRAREERLPHASTSPVARCLMGVLLHASTSPVARWLMGVLLFESSSGGAVVLTCGFERWVDRSLFGGLQLAADADMS